MYMLNMGDKMHTMDQKHTSHGIMHKTSVIHIYRITKYEWNSHKALMLVAISDTVLRNNNAVDNIKSH